MPDLILKSLDYDGELEILGEGNQIRHYTYGEDLAKFCTLLTHENAKIMISTFPSESTTVLN